MFLKKMLKKLQINSQGFKIKGFSLLEIITTLVLISIILSFAIPKFQEINNKSHLVTLKSQFFLIQTAITKTKSKNILLADSSEIILLDEAMVDKKDEKLFSNIVDFTLLSTNTNEKKVGNWAKISSKEYVFYLASSSVLFALENGFFKCKSEENICKEIE